MKDYEILLHGSAEDAFRDTIRCVTDAATKVGLLYHEDMRRILIAEAERIGKHDPQNAAHDGRQGVTL